MKKIRIGLFGSSVRGMSLARNFMLLDAEIVAICESHKEFRESAIKKLPSGVIAYDNFDDFINHPMDAVVLTNSFHQHAPYAIKCLEKNLHVFSECLANGTMGEGVALVRAFEKSKSIYMLGENYPFMLFNREMKRVIDTGNLGKILYAEGEYNHPISPLDVDFTKKRVFHPKHWRRYTPITYYITHSLGPVMYFTGATPKKVSAFAMFAPTTEEIAVTTYCADKSANISTFNDDGSVFRITACSQYGGAHNSYRVCGTKGQIENLRGKNELMLRYNEWDTPEGAQSVNCYYPTFNDKDEELIKKSEHDGGDFIIVRLFLNCIKEGKQPPHPFDIYSATTISSVAFLAHRSVLNGGQVYDIPDFKNEEDRKLWENDFLTPYYDEGGNEPTLPCCSHPNYKPTEKQIELYLKMLEK